MALFNGTAGNEQLIGSDLDDTLNGLGGNDTLLGGGGDDVLNGGVGDDSMSGGAGDDIYYVQSAQDKVVEAAGAGIDTVWSWLASYTLGAGVENVRIMSAGAANAIGNALDNTFVAGAGDNNILGGGGSDTVSYFYATSGVTVSLGTSLAQNTGGSGVDTLKSIENLTGSTFNDTLSGSAGNNIINGGAGVDTLLLIAAGAGVNINLGTTGAQNTGALGMDTILNIENLSGSNYADKLTGSTHANVLLGADGNDFLAGGDGADQLDGGSGNDTLNGGNGADTMSGGWGDDLYVVNSAGDTITGESGGWGDTVKSLMSNYTLDDVIENLVIASNGAANGTGNWQDNHIYAGSGDNVIDGGDGEDTVDFSQGAGAGVVVDLAAGTATGGSGSDTLQNIENVTGTAFADSISGSSFYSVIDGGAGADTMTGGSGGTTYYVDDAGDEVIADANANDTVYSSLADYTMADHVEELVIDTASAANVTGNAEWNSIYAGDGDNVIDGGAGTNTIHYEYSSSGVTVSLALAGAQATGGSGTDTLANFSRIYGSYFNDNLSGNAEANYISGYWGVDTMSGAGGDDGYLVSDIGDLVIEEAGAGVDTVYSMLSAYTLADNVENGVVHTTSSIRLTGNALDNRISGYTGNDTLDGGAGNDTVVLNGASGAIVASLATGTSTGAGNDTLLNFENIVGNAYGDTLGGNQAANLLDGRAGSDTLNGAGGNDTLIGGDGSDALNGGAGNDTFVFSSSLSALNNVDTISGFVSGSDVISLDNSYFFTLADGALAAGNFVIGAAAADGNDYIVYNDQTGALYYDADGSGAGSQIQFATLSGSPALGVADFIVS